MNAAILPDAAVFYQMTNLSAAARDGCGNFRYIYNFNIYALFGEEYDHPYERMGGSVFYIKSVSDK